MMYRRPASAGPRLALAPRRSLTRRLLAAMLLLVLLGMLPRAYAQALHVARYSNVIDRPFSTISNGPQSAVVLDLPAGTSDADTQAATLKVTRSLFHAQAKLLAPQIDRLRRRGKMRSSTALPVSQIIQVRRGGVLVRPAAATRAAGVTRAVGGGTLTFTYSGFNATDQAFLQQIAAAVYPSIVNVYGQPAVSGNVTVVNAGGENSTLTDKQYLAFGVYDASNNQILLPTFNSNESFVQAYILMMIHAFHGPAVFQYDAWEQGFARAAAAVVARQTATSVGITDPSANGLLDILPYYDLNNQPSLGNSTFFPPSQAQVVIDSQTATASMFFVRLGMSGAAWLKVYIENPSFFSQFNAAYYAQFDATVTPSLAGNVPALRAIASALLPNGVEGQTWDTWYQQQYVLDTSNSSGEQLFAFLLPGTYDPTDATAGQSNGIFLTYFIGQQNGDETLPGSATATATYLDATDARLNLGQTSSQSTIVNGEGSLTTLTFPTQGVDSGRITVDVHCGNASTRTYFASGFTGDFQGVVLGPNSTGNATVTESTVPSVTVRTQTGALTNAGFGVTLGSATTDLAVTTVTLDNGGAAPTTYRINTGDGQYYAVIRRGNTGGGTVVASQTFATSDLPSLVTFPVQPLSRIVDQALGLDGSAFVLSYWDVTQATYETLIPGQTSVAPIQMGRGYWFKLEPTAAYTSKLVSVTGVAPSTDVDFTLGLSYGWNLIGSPFAQPIDISTILVQFGSNDAISFSDAVADSLVAATPFSWDPTAAAYSSVTTIDGTNWQGYWLRVLVPNGVTLLLPGPSATGRAAQTHRAVLSRSKTAATPAPDWKVRLRATQQSSVLLLGRASGRVSQTAATFGVGRSVKTTGFDNRYDLEAPPAVAPALTLGFPHKEWGNGKATNAYVADFRSSAAASTNTTWNVDVQTPNSGNVTLIWDGASALPKTTKLTLVDTASNTRTPLQTRSSYSFAAVGGQTRSFQIVTEAARSVPLTITPIFAASTRKPRAAGTRSVAAGMNIGYAVSTAADVTVSFSALNGRVVRQLATTRATAALTQSAYWDGKGTNGQPLPAGLYRVEIVAHTDDGAEVHYIRPVMLVQ